MKYRLQQLAGIKSLYEQQESSCVSITYSPDCPQNPNQGSNAQGSFPNNKCIFINNQTPSVGDGFRYGGPNDIFKVTSVTPNSNGTSNQNLPAASCGGTTTTTTTTTGSLTGSGTTTTTTGSATGSVIGSGTGCPTPSQVSASLWPSQNPNFPPTVGFHGINQNFVNNMANKSVSFYQNRVMAFQGKWNSLAGNYPIPPVYPSNPGFTATPNGQFMAYCQGESPMWQAQLHNRIQYVKACIQLPGSC